MSLFVRGPWLTLRYASADDVEPLFELARDPDVTRFFSWGPYRRVAQARAYVDRLAGERRAGVKLDLIIEHAEQGVIGVTGLSEYSRRDRRAVVGTWLGRSWWGTGANLESKALLAQFAFDRLDLYRLGAYSHPDHGRSARALGRIGFEREGLLRGFHRHGDRQLDVIAWSLLRADWEGGELTRVPARISGRPPRAFLP